jgi:hypothetical protein
MEDIANRTADISERRIDAIAAARAAGAGDAASLRQEKLFNTREADLNRAILQRTNAIKAQLETRYGKEGMYTNKNYQTEYENLYRNSVAPLELQLNTLYSQRNPDLFPAPNPQATELPAGTTVKRVGK